MKPINIREMPVGELMRMWPETVPVFLEYRTHCVGCPIAMFHTLNDSATAHGNNADRFAGAIQRAITPAEDD